MTDVLPIGFTSDRPSGSSTASCAAHTGTIVGDLQVLSWGSHASIVTPTPSGTGWRKIHDATTTHQHFAIWTRMVPTGETGTAVTTASGAHQALELRTYRGAKNAVLSGSGTGLVHPSRVVDGLLLRITVDAEDNGASFPPVKVLTPAAALTDQTDTGSRAYQWYNGMASGHDPTASGGTAPARTTVETDQATGTPLVRFPQWADVMITPNPGTLIVDRQQYSTGAASGTFAIATLAAAPLAGDLLVCVIDEFAGGSAETKPVGGGGTWQLVSPDGRDTILDTDTTSNITSKTFISRDANASGPINLVMGGVTFRGSAHTMVLRSTSGGYLSMLRRVISYTAITSMSATARRAKAGDLVVAVGSWYATSGDPTLTLTPVASGNGTLTDSGFTESQIAWRTATATEDVAVSSTRVTSANSGALTVLTFTAALTQPQEPQREQQSRLEISTGFPLVQTIPLNAHEFLPGDIVAVMEPTFNFVESSFVPTGLGATWTKTVVQTGQNPLVMWIGTGPTTPGILTLTATAIAQGEINVVVVRGAQAGAVKVVSAYGDVKTLVGPAVAAGPGEFVVGYGFQGSGSGTFIFPVAASRTPSAGWTWQQRRSNSFGGGVLASRVSTATAGTTETHQLSQSLTGTSARHTVAMMRFGVAVEHIIETLTATSDLTVTLSSPPKRLAVRFDMQGTDLHGNPDASIAAPSGSDPLGWNLDTGPGFSVAPRGPSTKGAYIAVSSGIGPGLSIGGSIGDLDYFGGSPYVPVEVGKRIAFGVWAYKDAPADWIANLTVYPYVAGATYDPDDPALPLIYSQDLPSRQWVFLRSEAPSPTVAGYASMDVQLGVTSVPGGAAGNLYIQFTDASITQEIGPRSSLIVNIPDRTLTETLTATSDLLVTFPDDWKFEASSDLLVTLTRHLVETITATSDLTVVLSLPPTTFEAVADLLVLFTEFSSVTFDATSDLLVTLTVPPFETNTTNRVGGRSRTGYGVASWTPDVVPTPPPSTVNGVIVGGTRIAAVAHGPVTMHGATPTYTSSWADSPRARQRILYNGRDITYFRDVVTPDVTYGLTEPLLYGPGVLSLPQVSGIFEEPGVSAGIKWLEMGGDIVVQLVVDDVVVDEVYKGIAVAWEPDGTGISVELGGEAQGRAALMVKEPPIFRDYLDIGRLAWRAIRNLGLPFEPRIGPVTGIESATFGSDSMSGYIDELCAKGWTREGRQWTIMPDEFGTYRMQRKDGDTVHFTVFTDDAWSVPALRRDLSEEPNRIYATGVTPEGQRVRFGVYPGLQQGTVPAYPVAGDAPFGLGTTNADTITGYGISALINRLWTTGFINLADKPGGYDEDIRQGVKAMQTKAGLAPTGVMNVASWRALWDLDKTGYSLRGSAIQPAAQKGYTRPYRRTASGAVIGRNKNYDPHRPKVDRHVDMGTGFWRGQIREWAEAKLVGEENYVGAITLTTGAVLNGVVEKGTTVTPEMLLDARQIRPGMNAWLPMHAGGIVVHVSAVDVANDSISLTVDTQFRDAPEVWEIIARNRETRNDPARKRRGNRSSTEPKDSIDPWDEGPAGKIDGDVKLTKGWNVVEVVAGQEGTVALIDTRIQDVTVNEDGEESYGRGAEYCLLVSSRMITPARLTSLNPDPLSAAGTKRWENKKVANALKARDVLYIAGTSEEPCGYSPGKKHHKEREVEQPNPDYDPETDDDSDKVITVTVTESWGKVTGQHTDAAGFAYRTGPEPVLYLCVHVARDTTLRGGRIMRNQLESGA